MFNVVSRDGLFSKSKDEFIKKYSLKKKDLGQVLESGSGFVQRGIISDTERPIQVGQSESSPGINRPFTRQYMENRYSINKPQDLQKETPQESPQPQLEAPKCDPATQVFDASSNQCIDISSVTEVFSDNEKINSRNSSRIRLRVWMN